MTASDWAEAALQLIAEAGLRALTVSVLASRLGVTKGSFYWHFTGRDDLLAAALGRWERSVTDIIRSLEAIDAAMDGSRPPTAWQRLPVLPRVVGLMLIKSQMPEAKRKFTAPRKAEPASSAIDPRIIERFVAYQHEAAARVRSLDGRDVARIIMVSPFVSFITYSVLDGCRLIVTHERRHLEQARRVTLAPEFPSSA